ncbi:MAG TPA: hypothetical protein VJY62_08125, partial [Bacteroidia bacterium]|nr:hypothetical protein [Bacteroidia bacterium]
MNTDIQALLKFIQQSKDLTAAEKRNISKTIQKVNDELKNKSRDLEIEVSLERVRTVAMNMKQPADMLEICRVISEQLKILHVKEIRNIQTAVFYEPKRMYVNYEYFPHPDKTTITEVDYNSQ